MTTIEVLGAIPVAVWRLVTFPLLKVFGADREPRFDCELLHASPNNVVADQTTLIGKIRLRRQLWFGVIESVPDCRVVLQLQPVGNPKHQRRVPGAWWNAAGTTDYFVERALSEGDNPYYVIPLLFVSDQAFRLETGVRYEKDRVYLADLAFVQGQPTLRALPPGEHYLSLELISKERTRATFRWLVSVSSVARFVAVESLISAARTPEFTRHCFKRDDDGVTVIRQRFGPSGPALGSEALRLTSDSP